MNLKSAFPNLNGTWLRWSDYRIENIKGITYILPDDSAFSIQYSSTENIEQMLTDALNVGRSSAEQSIGINKACLDFARKYGLLGISAYKEENMSNQCADCYSEVSDEDVTPNCRGLTSKKYGESLEYFTEVMRLLYLHFLTAIGKSSGINENELKKMRLQSEQPIAFGMSYRLTASETPTLSWKPDNLLTLLKLGYALTITDSPVPLKKCKHCGSVYYNPHTRSEFCSAKCRNHYNVQAYRERKKE